MIGDMPSISDASHAHTIYGLGNLSVPVGTIAATNTVGIVNISQSASGFPLVRGQALTPHQRLNTTINENQEKTIMIPARRLVQVFIADPDENVPLEQSMLYSGTQKLTDATDQELFFEIDMKTILEIHNEKRIKLVNKKVKERTEYLEPAKIRDLKMVVVNVATF